MEKHICYGFIPPVYLSNRSQRVFFNGSLNNTIQVESGILNDSTLLTSATTESEITATLHEELLLVSKWVAGNKSVLNILKTKSIVCGTNDSLNNKPQLNHVINDVES
jgi:hypothetical protein